MAPSIFSRFAVVMLAGGLSACFGRTPTENLLCQGGRPLGGGRCTTPLAPFDAGFGGGGFDPFDSGEPSRDAAEAPDLPGSFDFGAGDTGAAPDLGGAAPVIVEPALLDFETVRLSSTRILPLSIFNPGPDRTVRLTLVPVTADFTLNRTSLFVAAGGEATIQILFRPLLAAAEEARIVVESCSGLCPFEVPLRGTGVEPGVQCDAVDAGQVMAGSCTRTQIPCQSRVNQQVVFEPGSVSGPIGGRILSDRFVVQPRAPFTVDVELCAPRRGSFEGRVEGRFQYPGSLVEPLSVEVAIEGTDNMPPTCTISVVPSIDFGSVGVGQRSEERPLFSNTGTGLCVLTSPQLLGPQRSAFRSSFTGGGITVVPGTAFSPTLTFSPTRVETASATFVVNTNQVASPEVRIDLSGRGVATTPVTSFNIIRTNGTPPILPSGRSLRFTDTDDGYAREPIPFNFSFLGAPVSEVFVSSNGFITFDQRSAGSLNNRAIPSGNNPNSIIAWFWDDLILDLPSSSVQVVLSGTAPNRQLLFGFRNIRKFRGGGVMNADTELNLRIELHESTNEIIVHYGVALSRQAQSAFETSVGWENANGSAGGSPLTCSPNCALSDWPANARIRYVPQ